MRTRCGFPKQREIMVPGVDSRIELIKGDYTR